MPAYFQRNSIMRQLPYRFAAATRFTISATAFHFFRMTDRFANLAGIFPLCFTKSMKVSAKSSCVADVTYSETYWSPHPQTRGSQSSVILSNEVRKVHIPADRVFAVLHVLIHSPVQPTSDTTL